MSNPINDANGMADALAASGFKVSIVTDATLAKMNTAAASFLSSIEPDSMVLFYYSGHGIQIHGQNFLIPVDFTASDERSARESSFNVDDLLSSLEKVRSRLRIIVLDTCNDNPFSRSLNNSLVLTPGSAEGTFIALATAAGSTASDGGDRKNGLFTSFLIDALRTPGLNLDQIFNQVRTRVVAATSKAQWPYVYKNVVGDFYFRPPAGYQEISDLPRSDVAPASPPRGRVSEVTPPPLIKQPKDLVLSKRHADLARQYFKTGDYPKAASEFTSALEADYDAADLFHGRALCYEEMRSYSNAVQDFSEAIALKPDDWKSYWGRARARDLLGDHEGFIDDDKKARSVRQKGTAR